MFMDEIDPKEIQIGQQYQLESKHYYACTVTVLEDQSGENKERRTGKNWVGFLLRVDEVIFGDIEEGDEFECGYNTQYSAFKDWKFKPVGSETEYEG